MCRTISVYNNYCIIKILNKTVHVIDADTGSCEITPILIHYMRRYKYPLIDIMLPPPAYESNTGYDASLAISFTRILQVLIWSFIYSTLKYLQYLHL